MNVHIGVIGYVIALRLQPADHVILPSEHIITIEAISIAESEMGGIIGAIKAYLVCSCVTVAISIVYTEAAEYVIRLSSRYCILKAYIAGVIVSAQNKRNKRLFAASAIS
ncbi:hypothetical protein BBJ66_05340 [Rhizobium sp. RSm-3]|nr:hypothetical protein BBJ66_05340 [Rhizobium sp. RSm-3]